MFLSCFCSGSVVVCSAFVAVLSWFVVFLSCFCSNFEVIWRRRVCLFHKLGTPIQLFLACMSFVSVLVVLSPNG